MFIELNIWMDVGFSDLNQVSIDLSMWVNSYPLPTSGDITNK